MSKFVCCGDIGGTNSRIELWEVPPAPAVPERHFSHTYPSRAFTNLESLIVTAARKAGWPVPLDPAGELAPQEEYEAYVAAGGRCIDSCVVALCGPVADDIRHCGPAIGGPTDWGVDMNALRARLGSFVRCARLLNDFVAVGLGITMLCEEDLLVINAGQASATGPKFCIGAGTGLGECYVTYHNGLYHAQPSEGGMCTFTATTQEELDLYNFLRLREGGPIEIETAVSGRGIQNIFEFFCQRRGLPVSLASPELVTEAAKVGEGDEGLAARDAVTLMLRLYLREIRESALRFLPTGGIYIAGGLALKVEEMAVELFRKEFTHDSKLHEIIGSIPLYLVRREDVGVIGAKCSAFRLLSE